jgi:hypothetical protein
MFDALRPGPKGGASLVVCFNHADTAGVPRASIPLPREMVYYHSRSFLWLTKLPSFHQPKARRWEPLPARSWLR